VIRPILPLACLPTDCPYGSFGFVLLELLLYQTDGQPETAHSFLLVIMVRFTQMCDCFHRGTLVSRLSSAITSVRWTCCLGLDPRSFSIHRIVKEPIRHSSQIRNKSKSLSRRRQENSQGFCPFGCPTTCHTSRSRRKTAAQVDLDLCHRCHPWLKPESADALASARQDQTDGRGRRSSPRITPAFRTSPAAFFRIHLWSIS
jgi:hypothetical protein